MQFSGLHPLGLQTPGMQVDGLHEACACALLTEMVASIAGAVYTAALRKWRRARSRSFDSPTRFGLARNHTLVPADGAIIRVHARTAGTPDQPSSLSSAELNLAEILDNCVSKYLLTTVLPKLYRTTVGG